MTDHEVTVILKDALEKIKRGWCQGISLKPEADGTEKFCATGAILYAMLEREYHGWSVGEITPELDKHIPDGSLNKPDPFHNGDEYTATRRVVLYNNTHTQQEVVEVFDKALAELGGI